MDLEEQIRGLQRELAEVEKEQAVLRLQPCRGDSEIAKKDAKFDELDRKGAILENHRGPDQETPTVDSPIHFWPDPILT